MGDVVALTDGKQGWEVREQALKLIQAWAIEFKDRSGPFVVFTETYVQLKTKGVTFPDPEHTAPVFMEEPPSSQAAEPVEPTDPTMKLAQDLSVVAEKIKLCREMLPESSGIETDDALAEVVGFLEACKPRMVDLIECGMQGMLGEDLVSQTLQVNDDLLKTLEAEKNGTPLPVETKPPIDSRSAEVEQPNAVEAQSQDLLSFNSFEQEPDLRSAARKKKLAAAPIVGNEDLLALSTLSSSPAPGPTLGTPSPITLPVDVATTPLPTVPTGDVFAASIISPKEPAAAAVSVNNPDPFGEIFDGSPPKGSTTIPTQPATSPFDGIDIAAPPQPATGNPFEGLDNLQSGMGELSISSNPNAAPKAVPKTNII